MLFSVAKDAAAGKVAPISRELFVGHKGGLGKAGGKSGLSSTRNHQSALLYLRWHLSLVDAFIPEPKMDTARIFQSGRSQAVRLPKEFRFAGTEVGVRHFGNGVLLLPTDDPWATLEAGLSSFEPGFTISREQPEPQIRTDIAA